MYEVTVLYNTGFSIERAGIIGVGVPNNASISVDFFSSSNSLLK